MITLEWWIIATIIAALTQTLRSAVQRQMKPVLGDDGASYIRFLYALPFAWVIVLGYRHISDIALPSTTLQFWLWVNLASLTQIIFTVLLIRIFSRRSFAAGTAFSKTEVLQAAILETIILGVMVSVMTGLGIIVGVIAVIMLAFAKSALTRKEILKSCFSRTSAVGLASGAFLGLATVCYKAAAISLVGGDLFLKAIYTGGIATTIQVIVMGFWMIVFTRQQFIACFVHWRRSIGAGLFGAIATIGWFTAFMLQTVASVRAVGQIELLITLAISALWFKEKTNVIETLAILLLTLSIVMVLLGS